MESMMKNRIGGEQIALWGSLQPERADQERQSCPASRRQRTGLAWRLHHEATRLAAREDLL
jgi:hypothetical protein